MATCICRAAVFNTKMAVYAAARPTYKMAMNIESFFSSKMAVYTCTRLPGLHIKMAICTTAVFNAKMTLYTIAGPTYEHGYIHDSCFWSKKDYINSCQAFIWTWQYTQQLLSKQKWLYKRMPGLHIKWLYTREPFYSKNGYIHDFRAFV